MKLFFRAPKIWIRNYSQHTEQHDYSNASVCCIYLNHRTFNNMFRPSMRQFFRAPKSYVKAKHKTQNCHCRPARGMPYWWDGPIFSQYINLYLPKLTIDLADPYNSMLAHLKRLCSKQCGPRSDCYHSSSLIRVHTICLYTEIS